MANTFTLFFIALALSALIMASNVAVARPALLDDPARSPTSSLELRLKLDDESSDCWDSLTELQACSTEIILFFLNGETDLGQGCCEAIRTIANQCWPNMIETLGFTSEEGDILEGYCDHEIETTDAHSSTSTHSVVTSLP